MAGAFTHNGNVVYGLPNDASQVNFNKTGTDLTATQVENAIKEVNTKVNTVNDSKEPLGGTTTGNKSFKVGGNLELRTDAEGGNINITSDEDVQFEIDAYTNTFRVWSDKSGSYKFLTWDGNEDINLNDIKNGLTNKQDSLELGMITDLNNAPNGIGIYDTNTANIPTSGQHGVVLTMLTSYNDMPFGMQYAIDHSTPIVMHFRINWNGWGSWKTVSSS